MTQENFNNTQKKTNRKGRVALLSVISNSTLIFLKIIAGLMSGSVSIISEAIHSGMDLMASLIAFYSVNVSSKPADKEHPYGHGKIENISGFIEGVLIFIAAFLIIKEAVHKLLNPTDVSDTTLAIVVMLISAAVNFFISNTLYKVAKEEDSIALEADALHLKTDVYTSLGVALGLILIKITGISMLDPIVAIIVALIIIKEAWHLCVVAFQPLLDGKLSDADEEQIHGVIMTFNQNIIDYHDLKTRKSGHIKHIDFHITLDKAMTIEESYEMVMKLTDALEETLKNTAVHIHVDPGSMIA